MGEYQFEIYRSVNVRRLRREWRWRFRASNGRIIAQSSEGYVNLADCMSMMTKMRNDAEHAPLVEV